MKTPAEQALGSTPMGSTRAVPRGRRLLMGTTSALILAVCFAWLSFGREVKAYIITQRLEGASCDELGKRWQEFMDVARSENVIGHGHLSPWFLRRMVMATDRASCGLALEVKFQTAIALGWTDRQIEEYRSWLIDYSSRRSTPEERERMRESLERYR